MKKISLVQMKEGQKGKVCEINGGSALHSRFLSMNIYEGKEVTKISHFALRGPVTVKVGRSVMALGHGMAAKVFLEVHD